MITKKEYKQGLLNDLYAPYKNCNLCPLSQKRTHVVFGRGNPDAQLLILGEGPGKDEDNQGLPFIGRSGKLLSKILKGLNIKEEEDVYITNIVKCRPPNNRPPLLTEINTCTSILLNNQIEIINPTIICALGTSAAQTLLASKKPLSQFKGSIMPYKNRLMIATYHPAYILRNPKELQTLSNDIELAYTTSITNENI